MATTQLLNATDELERRIAHLVAASNDVADAAQAVVLAAESLDDDESFPTFYIGLITSCAVEYRNIEIDLDGSVYSLDCLANDPGAPQRELSRLVRALVNDVEAGVA